MTAPEGVGDGLAHGDEAAVVARRPGHLAEARVLPQGRMVHVSTEAAGSGLSGGRVLDVKAHNLLALPLAKYLKYIAATSSSSAHGA